MCFNLKSVTIDCIKGMAGLVLIFSKMQVDRVTKKGIELSNSACLTHFLAYLIRLASIVWVRWCGRFSRSKSEKNI